MFDAALEHGAVRQCLYQAQRMVSEYDEQRSFALRPTRHLQMVPVGITLVQRSNSNPAGSVAARQHLFNVLRGRHQRFLRTCLAGGQLSLALDYIRLLPRNEQLFTAFLKEAVTFCSLDQMHEILQVRASVLIIASIPLLDIEEAHSFEAIARRAPLHLPHSIVVLWLAGYTVAKFSKALVIMLSAGRCGQPWAWQKTSTRCQP